jgi:transposase-like protein
VPYPKNPTLTALWMTDPAKAAAEVSAVLRSTTSLSAAAKALGVGRRTLYRWMRTRPELREVNGLLGG